MGAVGSGGMVPSVEETVVEDWLPPPAVVVLTGRRVVGFTVVAGVSLEMVDSSIPVFVVVRSVSAVVSHDGSADGPLLSGPSGGVTDGLEQAATVRQKAVTSNKDKILFISLLFFPFKCSSLSSSAKRSELLEHFLGNSPAPRVIAVAGIQHTGSIKWPKPVVHVPVRTPCVSCHNRVPVGQISRHALPWDRKIDIKGGSQEYVGVRESALDTLDNGGKIANLRRGGKPIVCPQQDDDIIGIQLFQRGFEEGFVNSGELLGIRRGVPPVVDDALHAFVAFLDKTLQSDLAALRHQFDRVGLSGFHSPQAGLPGLQPIARGIDPDGFAAVSLNGKDSTARLLQVKEIRARPFEPD